MYFSETGDVVAETVSDLLVCADVARHDELLGAIANKLLTWTAKYQADVPQTLPPHLSGSVLRGLTRLATSQNLEDVNSVLTFEMAGHVLARLHNDTTHQVPAAA